MPEKRKESWLHRQAHRYHLLLAVESTLALLISFYCAYGFSVLINFPAPDIAGLWAAVSSAIVITPVRELAIKSAWLRFSGSIIGSIIPMIFVYIFGYSILAFACSIFLTVIVCYAVSWHESYHVALCTVAVVVFVGQALQATTSIWLNAMSRLAESAIGISVALIIVLALHPLRKIWNLITEAKD